VRGRLRLPLGGKAGAGLALSVAALAAGTLPTTSTAVEPTPNILIIMTDDQRASEDGYSVMDGMLRIFKGEGTYFPNAVATTPLCCPSRASIFSGRYAHNTGVTVQDPSKFNTLTTMQYQLRSRGYKTALTGKYLNNFSGTPPHFDYVAKKAGYYNNGIYSTHFIRDKALTFLNQFEANDTQPWLMYVHTVAPHTPADPETQYLNAPVPPWVDDPARLETDRTDKPPYVQKRNPSKSAIQTTRTKQIRTLYSVDDLIEAVFARLTALGEDNTLAFFLSDNGYMWYEHKLDLKNHVYNDSVKIPLFMRWPGHVPAGVTDTDTVANIDIAPTVYEATGIFPTNYTVDGRSLFSSARDHILTEGWGNGSPFRALWTPSWTYAEYTNNGFKEYYAPDDPWQLDNGFKTNDIPSNAAALHQQLEAEKACVGAACP
jgi:arylsulfatase A-like enzyme